jgi:hypothetical protein
MPVGAWIETVLSQWVDAQIAGLAAWGLMSIVRPPRDPGVWPGCKAKGGIARTQGDER